MLTDQKSQDYLKECVYIEPAAIEEEFIRLPADLAYWNEQLTTALRARLRADLAVKQQEAQLLITERERLAASGAKATEAAVAAAVKVHPAMRAADEADLEAEVEYSRLRGIVSALQAKREMLVSLGANLRVEMQGDPLLREQQKAARTVGQNQRAR